MAYPLSFFHAAALLLAVWVVTRMLAKKPAGRLPPGPKQLPLLGNVLDMPQGHEWQTFNRWGQQFGDIVSVRILGQPYIILNSVRHATELLDKRSVIYSGRPNITVGGKWAGWDRFLGTLHYGTTFRRSRCLAFGFMGTRKAVESYHSVIDTQTRSLILHVADDASKLAQHIQRCAGAVILALSYGYEVQDGFDQFAKTFDDAMQTYAKFTPLGFLPNRFSFLSYFPGWLVDIGWKKTAREWRARVDRMVDEPIAWVKKQMAAGTARPSLVSTNLDEDLPREHDALVKNVAASLYIGGVDPTVSAINTFYLAMLVRPDVMQRAQAEIDAVIGRDHLPTIEDRDRLPYVQALYLETLRWQQAAPLGMPHRVTEDDLYEGYYLPKGSVVIANIWGMMHDPETYPYPSTFNPDRFVASPGHEPEQDPRDMVFGFGRRICPGHVLADVSVWLAIAMALAVFDIKQPVEGGQLVQPKVEYTSGPISHPMPFKVAVKPRSAKAEALLKQIHDDQH